MEKNQDSGFGIQEETAKAPPNSSSESKPVNPAPSASHPDPTRYGDWEINGKCVDF